MRWFGAPRQERHQGGRGCHQRRRHPRHHQEAGDITKKDINTVLPFGNTLSIVKVTGAELLEALEASDLLHAGFHRRLPPGQRHRVYTVDGTKTYDAGRCSMPAPPTTHPRPSAVLRSSPLAARPSTSERSTPSLPMTSWLPAAIPITHSRPLPSTTIWVSPWTRS